MTDEAQYTFVPWAREGYKPEGSDGEGTVGVTVTVDASGEGGSTDDSAEVNLALYGPGEVTGIDHRQVVRTEPTSGTSDFPPNHFPIVEFDNPELPWLFSPEPEQSDGKYRPWIALITVKKEEGVSLQTGVDGPAAILDIRDPASPGDHLPDPSESWAWAHSQVVGADDVGTELSTDRSEKTLSRLLSPRELEPQTSYYACVVPTYEPGRLAGLGKKPFERDDEGNVVREYPDAWDPANPPGQLRLPVYYHWEFSTGKAGDFESLVRRLESQVLEDVGVRQVDAGDPGPPSLEKAGEVVTQEGALKSANISPDTYSEDVKTELTSILDDASALAPESAVPGETEDDRILGPPIYGQWPPAASTVPGDGEMPIWLRDVNEDPRFRVSAAYGTEVVQDQQEQLMAEAWRQVGDIREANQALRRARLAQGASQQVHDGFDQLTSAAVLTLTEPVHGRTLDEAGAETISNAVDGSALPESVISPAFRRITRPNGPLSRRLGGIRRERIVEDANDRNLGLGDDGSTPTGAQVIGDDLAEDLCTQSRPDDDLEEWDVLGPARDVDPVEFAATARQRCKRARQRLQTAMEALQGQHWAGYTALDSVRESLHPICGHGDRGGDLLDDLPEALQELDWEAVASIVADIENWLANAARAQRQLETIADDEQVVADVLDETDALGKVDEFVTAVTVLEIRLMLERLFELACERAHDALDALSVPTEDWGLEERETGWRAAIESVIVERDEDAVRLVTELEAICAVLCGNTDGPGGLFAALREAVADNATRRVREIVDAMSRLVGMARPRLARLSELPVEGPIEALENACNTIGLYLAIFRRRLAEAPWDPVAEAVGPRVCKRPVPSPAPSLDLDATASATVSALDPTVTIPARLEARLAGLSLSDRAYPLAPIMAHPEFDEPMFGPLRDLGQEKLVPGVGDIPPDSVGVLETNPKFIESYMLGLSHEMARELRWREFPTDLRGTYFRQFWDPKGRDPPLEGEAKKDIDYIHQWHHDEELGYNYATTMAAKGDESGDAPDDVDTGGQLVLVVRGALFDRYPNTHVYAAKGEAATDDDTLERRPKLPDPFDDSVEGEVTHPTFRGTLDPDITFFGFDLDQEDALADPDDDTDFGWFFVIEEPPSGPSFGLDVERDEASDWTWEDLTWADVTVDGYVSVADEPSGDDVPSTLPSPPEWRKNGAHMGEITWIRPFRAAIHADDMLPANGGSG